MVLPVTHFIDLKLLMSHVPVRYESFSVNDTRTFTSCQRSDPTG